MKISSKIWTLLLSFLVAFGLWLYVITVVSPESEETYYDIPVTYQNDILEERGLMIVSEKPAVTLRLKGNRTDLNTLNANNISVLVNLAGIQAPGTHMLDYDLKFPGNIQASEITRLSQMPSQVVVKVENRLTKYVPVVVEFQGKVPEGFVEDKQNVVMDYAAIEISGPESVVSQMDHAKIQVDLNDKVESIIGSFFYTLCDKDGNKVEEILVTKSVDSVNLEVKIQQLKEIPLILNIIDGGGATEETCTIEKSMDTIWVSGSESKLKELNYLELGTIKLADLKHKVNTLDCNIELPEGVTNTTGKTVVTVTVTFPNLGKKILQIPDTNFQVVGVSEGYEVLWITEVLEVELRGPRDMINSINLEDVTVTLDFSQEEPGNVTQLPKITLSSKYAQVGAISANTITALLREIGSGTEG